MLTQRLIILSAALLTTSLAIAQNTYRWVDKVTGQTIFSDQPPPPDAKHVVTITAGERIDEQQLPYATRQAAEKFPVTLFTAATCVDECKQARDMLNRRGIPFSEKMLKSNEESAELSKILGSEAAVPSLIIGQQSLKGLDAGAWNNLLDLAGYPKSAPYGTRPSGAFAR